MWKSSSQRHSILPSATDRASLMFFTHCSGFQTFLMDVPLPHPPGHFASLSHLHRFPPQDEKVLRSHHHEAHELVAQNLLDLICLFEERTSHSSGGSVIEIIKCTSVMQERTSATARSIIRRVLIKHSCWHLNN